ncbi:MAG: aminotransferase class V-fold PLP-dependent enzyme [Clostridia bacterium]|nr:aminotransferase class V-fold PLP-dependent enzyme [Clostridia bacterium]
MIYLDHAATTPVRDEVLADMLPYFSQSFANASSGYSQARESRRAIDCARGEVADLIGANRSEIYFTSGGSESDNWALLGAAAAQPAKKHIITTKVEHHAVLHTCQALERRGYEVTYLGVDSMGRVLLKEFEEAIRPDTLMASVMLANNETGTIQPIRELSCIAHAYGIMMHTDAIQAVGHIPVNVADLDVDMLSVSAHKFGGPKGIGALYVKCGVRLEKLIYGGAQERNMRAGTENTPAIVGMGKAAVLSSRCMQQESAHVMALRDDLERKLLRIKGIRVNGDRTNRLPGHLHVSIGQANKTLLLMQLDLEGIAVSAGSACSSGAAIRSHVIEAMGLASDGQADIRFSIAAQNTTEEIDKTVTAIRRILKR